MYKTSFSEHPSYIVPPEFVEPTRESEPSGERERREEEVGSRDMDDVSLNQSRPAKSPKSPTFPIRSKSTFGSAHWTPSRTERATRVAKENTVLDFMARQFVVLGDYESVGENAGKIVKNENTG